MERLFKIEVDKEALTDALFSYVSDPRASRNQRAVIDELEDVVPSAIMIHEVREQADTLQPRRPRVTAGLIPVRDVLDTMVLDGVSHRKDVADFVSHLLASLGH